MEGASSAKAYIDSLQELPLALKGYQNVNWGNGTQLPTLTSIRGVKYTPLWMAVPFLEPFYTEFEKTFDAGPPAVALHKHAWVPVLSTILYLLFVYYGPKYMENRKPFDLKVPLAIWNLCLAVVSFMGAVRLVSHLIYLLTPGSGFTVHGLLCRAPDESYGDNATGFWVLLFTISKLFEYIDTVFVVLRKKPLIFLHWYHHSTVMCATWFGHVTFSPGLPFTAMNFSIHAVMYTYFFLMAIGRVPKWFNPKWLTVAQISQMFLGIYVTTCTVFYKYFTPEGCHVDDRMIVVFLLMYGTYAWLFVKFFFDRFARRNKKAVSGSKETTSADSSAVSKKAL